MARLQILENNDVSVSKKVFPQFTKKDGVKYCVSCGKECLSIDVVCKCGKKDFLLNGNSEVNEIMGGYITLTKNGDLKNLYYINKNKESIVKMNEKVIIQQLLLHRNKIDIDKKIIDKIYNTNLKGGLKGGLEGGYIKNKYSITRNYTK